MSHRKVEHDLDARILITVREYDKLVERSQKLSLSEKRYSHQLRSEVKPIQPSQTTLDTDSIEKIDEDQTGAGIDNDLIPNVIPPEVEIEQEKGSHQRVK